MSPRAPLTLVGGRTGLSQTLQRYPSTDGHPWGPSICARFLRSSHRPAPVEPLPRCRHAAGHDQSRGDGDSGGLGAGCGAGCGPGCRTEAAAVLHQVGQLRARRHQGGRRPAQPGPADAGRAGDEARLRRHPHQGRRGVHARGPEGLRRLHLLHLGRPDHTRHRQEPAHARRRARPRCCRRSPAARGSSASTRPPARSTARAIAGRPTAPTSIPTSRWSAASSSSTASSSRRG